MKVSVIVPFHGEGAYLQDCFVGLKEQEYQDMEVIVVCDGLFAEAEELAAAFSEVLSIRVLQMKEKQGVAAARNIGIKAASGEYIYFMDCDDYFVDQTIPKLLEMAQQQKAEIVYGDIIDTRFRRATYLNDVEDATEKKKKKKPVDGLETQTAPKEGATALEKAYYHLVSARNGLEKVSVLNVLFQSEFLKNNRILFQEDLKYHADIPFLIEALSCVENIAGCCEAAYIKAQHNDPINLPSLSQRKDADRFLDYVKGYQEAVKELPANHILKGKLDVKVRTYFENKFAPSLRKSEDTRYRGEFYDAMHKIMAAMDENSIKKLKGYRKRLIKSVVKGQRRKTLALARWHIGIRKFVGISTHRSQMAIFLYKHVFLKMPMKENWVFCESFFGKSYSDSPKYIYEYLQEHYPGKYRFIWVSDDTKRKIPYHPTKVVRPRFRYAYYLARCKYYVFNMRQPEWVQKREGNVMLETWHGIPIKKLMFDQDEYTGPSARYKQQVYNQTRVWDYIVSPNPYCTEIFRRCFMYEKEILETGYPRNDILHREGKEELARSLRERLHIPADKKVLLYAPTFRDDEYYQIGQYKFHLELNLSLLKEKLGEEYVILLRTHYIIADGLDITGLEDFAYNVSKYNDIAELYLISDVLITDYSSVSFDFANLKRPMLYFTYDLEKYRNVLRGFYIDIEEELPGPLLFTTEEVIEAICNIEQVKKDYQEKYDVFYEKYCGLEEGISAKRVVEAVFDS